MLVDTIGVLVEPMAVCAADRLAAAGAQSQLFVTGRREDEMGEQLSSTSAFARSVTFGHSKKFPEKKKKKKSEKLAMGAAGWSCLSPLDVR